MELNSFNALNNSNFEKYSESFNFKLIDLAFQYFNIDISKEQYEDEVELFISEFKEYKPNEAKFNLKFLIEFVEKNFNCEDGLLEEYLSGLSIMNFNFINETK